jgi:hypothetical protein
MISVINGYTNITPDVSTGLPKTGTSKYNTGHTRCTRHTRPPTDTSNPLYEVLLISNRILTFTFDIDSNVPDYWNVKLTMNIERQSSLIG